MSFSPLQQTNTTIINFNVNCSHQNETVLLSSRKANPEHLKSLSQERRSCKCAGHTDRRNRAQKPKQESPCFLTQQILQSGQTHMLSANFTNRTLDKEFRKLEEQFQLKTFEQNIDLNEADSLKKFVKAQISSNL